jgi:RNA polymerase sigma factor (sigma-70 family)
MAKVSNRDIVRELKEGSRMGCSHLIDLYQDRLIGEAAEVFHLPFEDAEEIVSDVLLAVVQKIQSFEFKRSDGDFHYWVMTIFRNRVRDFVRRHASTEGIMEMFDEAADETSFTSTEREVIALTVRQYEEALHDTEEEPVSDVSQSRSDRLETIVETLEGMEPWERVLLRCRALDVPYEEIALYTGKTVKQLKVYHGRVKKKFVKLLAERYPELVTE